MDTFTRGALAIEVDTSLSGARVVGVLEHLAPARGCPTHFVLDNGPKLTGHALDRRRTSGA